jgi:hypothetical protein
MKRISAKVSTEVRVFLYPSQADVRSQLDTQHWPESLRN